MKKLILFLVVLGSCSGRYASMHNTMNNCGYAKAAFSAFSGCMKNKVVTSKTYSENSYYQKSSQDIHDQLNYYEAQVEDENMTDTQAYLAFAQFVDQKAAQDRKSAQIASTVVAVGVLGVAAASCANNGCLGGGYPNSYNSYNSFQGCCSYHGGVSMVGNSPLCASGRVICNDGRFSPTCTC